jgi:hypothetical protein
MLFTILLAAAAFVAGVLVERNNAFIGTFVVGLKTVAINAYNAVVATVKNVIAFVKNLFAKKS